MRCSELIESIYMSWGILISSDFYIWKNNNIRALFKVSSVLWPNVPIKIVDMVLKLELHIAGSDNFSVFFASRTLLDLAFQRWTIRIDARSNWIRTQINIQFMFSVKLATCDFPLFWQLQVNRANFTHHSTHISFFVEISKSATTFTL